MLIYAASRGRREAASRNQLLSDFGNKSYHYRRISSLEAYFLSAFASFSSFCIH